MTNAISTDTRAPTPRQPALAVHALLLTWFGVVLALSLDGALESSPGHPPWPVLAAVLLPLAVFGAAYTLLEPVRAYVQALDLRVLVLLHTFRMLGVAFLLLAAFDVLPLEFALPAGVGDAVVAVAALALGVALYSATGVHRRLVQAWNTFGLADFVVAVCMGVLSRSDGLLQLDAAVSSDAMGSFPLALVPAFAVPFFVITHVIVFIQLRTRWADATRIHPGRRAGAGQRGP